jgi:N-acetylglutamate synthase-like GNAT family acetyltransferase
MAAPQSEPELTIKPATREDLAEILSLVAAVDLPSDGIEQYLGGFLVARDQRGNLLGTIGMERHGQLGLLRSAAVSPGLQRSGLGSMLASRLIADATAAGISEILLLTSTARAFFEKRDSPEWSLPRCSSAVLMRLKLTHGTE